jgi:8-oxo-dGTP diphosphatase
MKSQLHPTLKFAVLASDVALFTLRDDELYVRLIAVDRPPHFVNMRGLPGGLLQPTETAPEAAERQIKDKARIAPKKVHLEQLYTFSRVDRDKRGRVVAVGYTGLVAWESLSEEERSDSRETFWQRASTAKKLAYDHDEILSSALQRIRSRVHYTTLIQKLMPKEFTLTELEKGYEAVTGKALDKRNFRKKILKLGVVTPLPHKKSGGRFRPAQLYRFAKQNVDEIEVL